MTTPNIDLDDLKVQLCAEVDRRAEVIVGVSRALHAHPELGFAETYAHEVLTGALVDEGLDVSRAAYGLDTAFAAEAGTSGPTVAVVCEYDALPGLGHACGHNVIAAAGLGAGLAAAALAEVAGVLDEVAATPGDGSVAALEVANLAAVGSALVAAARRRTESRGAHTRIDAPDLDGEQARRVVCRRVDGGAEPFDVATAGGAG